MPLQEVNTNIDNGYKVSNPWKAKSVHSTAYFTHTIAAFYTKRHSGYFAFGYGKSRCALPVFRAL